MATIAILVDAPDHSTEAFTPGIAGLGHEVVRLIRAQLPIDDNVTLIEVAVSATRPTLSYDDAE